MAFYNLKAVKQGCARAYNSGFSKHKSFWNAEWSARQNGLRVWQQSDPENSTEVRNDPVDDLFFPNTASVRTSSGAVVDSRVPVYAESTAIQELDSGVSYGNIPLVAVVENSRVAVVGAQFVDESYEADEGYGTDTSSYGNFAFLTNLTDHPSAIDGQVLIDVGHGQFGASYALSCEDTAYYQRYLEGQGIDHEGINTITASNLARGRALLVTTPAEAFTTAEIDAINSFVNDGGSVILLGSGQISAEVRANLNDVAAGIGTDLRINADQVLDGTNNVNSDSGVVATTSFDTSFPLFSAYSGTEPTNISIPTINEDGSTLNDEYVVFQNDGSAAVDMTSWYVTDEANHTYTFLDGFTLDSGAQVTLHTGSGTATDTDL